MASLRVAAPKMASMAAANSVKVARSPMVSQFTRAYSGTYTTIAPPPLLIDGTKSVLGIDDAKRILR